MTLSSSDVEGESDNVTPILGEARLSYADAFAFWLSMTSRLPRSPKYWGIIVVGTLAISFITEFGARKGGGGLAHFPWALWLDLTVSALVFGVLFSWFVLTLGYWRIREDNKRLIYSVDAKGFVTADRANVELKIPWSEVTEARLTRRLLLFRLRARAAGARLALYSPAGVRRRGCRDGARPRQALTSPPGR